MDRIPPEIDNPQKQNTKENQHHIPQPLQLVGKIMKPQKIHEFKGLKAVTMRKPGNQSYQS